jgi:hypothetical protein
MFNISKFLEPLNHYDCLRVGLISQGFERTTQDGTLTYNKIQIQIFLIKIWMNGALWFRDDLSFVNDKNTLKKCQ